MKKSVNDEINASLYAAVATIDVSAIVGNYITLAKRVAPTQCSAVVKANAYGLGALKLLLPFIKLVVALFLSPKL